MIGRKKQRKTETSVERPKGYDDYDLRLGDVMRGERATLSKSLLDVQRELRIRASYIAAIENCDPTAFETPGFIPGYVRSYARYLGMDAEEAFEDFCAESGFVTAHGMSAEASTIRKVEPRLASIGNDPFSSPNLPFTPAQDSILSRIEPRAIGSSLVLVLLIAAIGYGAWSVLNEIQRVTLAPVEQKPVVLSDLDPVDAAISEKAEETAASAGVFSPPNDALDRLYRPKALDVPVLIARDAPISLLDPDSIGVFTADRPVISLNKPPARTPLSPKVVADAAPEVVLMAVRPAWVRVRSAEGNILLEKILDAGEEYVLPSTEAPPTLRAGMSGSIYFKVNGALYGPAGTGTNTVRDLALDTVSLEENFEIADLDGDPELARIVALAAAQNILISQD
ncbi:helix-turn-helix domain-containing protein [Pseudopelagicola sp. nBUS_20]|uniref:helix-turn-helix domain-containing protein n=1 Tax=Pseudopelagicola sp. nBUS_20 TaxID=3395317 RepID=UPI003EBD1A36